jgi:hypothetical protein
MRHVLCAADVTGKRFGPEWGNPVKALSAVGTRSGCSAAQHVVPLSAVSGTPTECNLCEVAAVGSALCAAVRQDT